MSDQETIERLTHERDQAIHEAARRDQKWMDGINEILGDTLDYDDPTARNNAQRALENWARKIRSQGEEGPCHECREVTLPMLTVTGPNVPRGTGKPRQFCSIHCFWKWVRRVESARDEAGRLDRIHSWD